MMSPDKQKPGFCILARQYLQTSSNPILAPRCVNSPREISNVQLRLFNLAFQTTTMDHDENNKHFSYMFAK